MDGKKILKELQKALERELWAVMVYSDDINRVSHKRARAVFADQAEHSAKHALQLRKAIHRIKMGQEVAKPLPAGGAVMLAKKGLMEEKAMLHHYQMLSSQSGDAGLKKLFKRIASEERHHIREINSLIKSLKKQKH